MDLDVLINMNMKKICITTVADLDVLIIYHNQININ